MSLPYFSIDLKAKDFLRIFFDIAFPFNKKKIPVLKIGKGKNEQPDNWFDNGGYEQLLFPKADNPFSKGRNIRTSVKTSKQPGILEEPIETNNFVSSEGGENFVQSLSEGSFTQGVGGLPADDGPSYSYGNFKSYKKRTDRIANRLGFEVVDYIIPDISYLCF